MRGERRSECRRGLEFADRRHRGVCGKDVLHFVDSSTMVCVFYSLSVKVLSLFFFFFLTLLSP